MKKVIKETGLNEYTMLNSLMRDDMYLYHRDNLVFATNIHTNKIKRYSHYNIQLIQQKYIWMS